MYSEQLFKKNYISIKQINSSSTAYLVMCLTANTINRSVNIYSCF